MKKAYKLLISLLVVITIFSSFLSFSTSAASVSFSGGEYEVGKQVNIKVKFTVEKGLSSTEGTVSYDKSVLRLDGVSGSTFNSKDNTFTDSKFNGENSTTASYTLNFIAIAAGETTVTVNITGKGETEEFAAVNSAVVKVVEPAPNADLGSLTVDGVELSPEFKPDVTEYSATVKYDVTNVNIRGSVSDGGATYIGGGAWSLDVGDNTRAITVTAQDGTTKKTYTVNIKRMTEEETAAEEEAEKNANPLLVIIDGIDYTIVNDFTDFKIPTGYTIGTTTRRETEISVLNDDHGEYQLFCLADPTGTVALYTCNENDIFTRVNYISTGGKMYIIEDSYFEGIVPEGYEVATRTVDGLEIDVYSYSDESLKDFYILKCYVDGNHGFYSFDTAERTMQRAIQFDLAVAATNSGSAENEEETANEGSFAWFKNMNSTGKVVFFAIICAGLLFIAIAVILIVKIASAGKKDFVDEDDAGIMPQDNDFVLLDDTYVDIQDEIPDVEEVNE